MSNQGTADTLPTEVSDALKSAYRAYKDSTERSPEHKEKAQYLAALAAAGRKADWPVRILAEPCGVSPERLRQIIRDWAAPRPPEGLPTFPKFKRQTASQPRRQPKPRRSVLSEAETKRLGELAPSARMNTGSRPLNSPHRKASKEFSALIKRLHKRGVVWADIAEASGMTISGIRMRAHRHGYGKGTPPSVKPYRDVVIHPAKKKSKRKKKDEESTTSSKKAKSA